jgi:hypothetical protein
MERDPSFILTDHPQTRSTKVEILNLLFDCLLMEVVTGKGFHPSREVPIR